MNTRSDNAVKLEDVDCSCWVGIARRPCEDGGACEWRAQNWEWSGMERGPEMERLRLNHDL